MLRTSVWKWELVNTTKKVSIGHIRKKASVEKGKVGITRVKIKQEKKNRNHEIKEKEDDGRRVTDKEQVAKIYFSENENSKTEHDLKTK